MKSNLPEYEMKGFEVTDIIRRMMFATQSRNQAELAERLGVRRAAVTDAKRRQAIPSDWFMRIGRMFSVNPLWLETGLGSYGLSEESIIAESPGAYKADEFAYVPKVSAVPRMGPEGLETDEEVEDFYAFRQQWLTRISMGSISALRLMAVAGDSMQPTLWDGDTVLVDQSQCDPVAGKIYVIGIDDGIVVKRVERRPGKLVLISDNHALYPPLEINLDESANVRVIGRVIWMAREVM
ncbi:MAG: LexA family transcriptional regulator [Desulfovibrio sp.]|uniref:LexA family transcriptional regulator n=1 Tax=Desulfovibrio sp. 7SRBS1 TaxID=3378064 RepID=UPI003B403209